ncbi:MAG: HAD hydrolase-like protein [Anaerolineales bacterium]|nr:HAD hydrolase-like protein [Anaerolineales bacterium]
MTLTLLIDLDDTLLPGSTSKFLPAYISALADYLELPFSKQNIAKIIYWATREALADAQIDKTIQNRFDKRFYPALGTTAEAQSERISKFYAEEFPKFTPVREPDPKAVALIETAFEKGYQVAIATNPIFPRAATYERLRWAGIAPEEYPLKIISTYENFHFGKPDPRFYLELIAQIGWPEGGFLMVGDSEEMDIQPAKSLGIPTFWLQAESNRADLSSTHTQGDLSEVHRWIEYRLNEELSLKLDSHFDYMNILAANPAAIDTLLRNAPGDIWAIGPKQEDWQINEILCHLRDVDREVHLPRLTAIRDEESPFLTAIDTDTWADERDYHRQDGLQAFKDLIETRKEVLSLAAHLLKIGGKKAIRHSIFGPITVNEILRIAARHDSLHVQQILGEIQPD